MPRTQIFLSSIAARLAGKSCGRKVNSPSIAITPFSTSSQRSQQEPFYGTPRPPQNKDQPRSIPNRLAVAIHYATTAFSDPTRADAVAALGEITGPITLQRLANQMKRDAVGKRILKDRPIVSKATIPYDKFIQEAPVVDSIDGMDVTFGQAYGFFLKSHDFDPDERAEVRFVEDEEQAYIMLRYRQVRLDSLFLSEGGNVITSA
jgi:Coenzyme Q (ubiquinone) biosynthesis protein Coq4